MYRTSAVCKINNYSVSILNKADREYVGQFFADHPNIDTKDFLRRAISLPFENSGNRNFRYSLTS
ncbi:hypothetical protein QFZ80_002265 [Paenibacillus sp. V4I7]|nr:hypothetical protein [Paenibacillus sp. V4I7]